MLYTVHKLILDNDLNISQVSPEMIKITGDIVKQDDTRNMKICEEICLIDKFAFNLMFNRNKCEWSGFIVPHESKDKYYTIYKDEKIKTTHKRFNHNLILKFTFNKLEKTVILLITSYIYSKINLYYIDNKEVHEMTDNNIKDAFALMKMTDLLTKNTLYITDDEDNEIEIVNKYATYSHYTFRFYREKDGRITLTINKIIRDRIYNWDKTYYLKDNIEIVKLDHEVIIIQLTNMEDKEDVQ